MPLSQLQGRKLMLCDMIYQKASKLTDWSDYLNIVYRDLVTGEKRLFIIKEPTIKIYEVKPEFRTFKKARHYLPKEQLIEHTVKYKDHLYEIAKLAGPQYEEFYKQRKTNSERRQLYKYPYVLGADIPIETYYRVMWDRLLGNDMKKEVSCIFLDIEVNQKHWEGSIPRHGECPIDLVSITDDDANTVHTFLLNVPDNNTIDRFIEYQTEFQQRLKDTFEDSYGEMTYKLYAFDDESELIKQVFKLIHFLKRDFCLIWNMAFDIPYIIDRIEVLGENARDIMCHPDFPVQSLYYYEDKNTFDFDKKRDYFDISSYTHYIDQIIMYASLRKSQGVVRKVNLGAVAKNELKDGKLDYTDVGNFIEFSYQDYPRYVLYNIKDTLLQMGINRKCHDMTTYYLSVYNSRCSYKDGLKQTVSLRSFFYDQFLLDDIILGHNVNFDAQMKKAESDDDDDDDDTFEGAINGDSMLNEHEGLIIFGKKSMFLFGHSIDFDFSAMYPNSICAFNIFAGCMIGKLIINNAEDMLNYDQDAGKEFVEDMIAQIPLFTGHKWFGLPNFEQLNEIIRERVGVA